MTWLLENPTPLMAMGIMLSVLFAGGWLKSGQRWPLFCMLGTVALTIGVFFLERTVVTERERVEELLYKMGDLVGKNQVDAALQHVHSSVPKLKERGQNEARNWRFQSVSITRLSIEMFPDQSPPKAIARFNVVVVVSSLRSTNLIDRQSVPRYMEITFLQESNKAWAMSDYHHDDYMKGFKKKK